MRAPRWLRELIAFAAAAWLAVALFPGFSAAASGGIDESWIWAINWLGTSPYLYGRDVNFTYGPLGYLALPVEVGTNTVQALSAQLAVHGLLVIAAWRFFRLASPLAALVSASLLIFGATVGFAAELRALLAAALYACWLASLPSMAVAALAALLAAGLLFVKLSLGLAATAVFLFALVLAYATPPRPAWRVLLAALLAFALTVLAIGQLSLGSIENLEPFFRTSLELAAGYSAALSLEGPVLQVWLALGACAACAALAWLLRSAGESEATRALVLLAPALLVAFKAGFVRQDGHVVTFFAFALFALALAAAYAGSWRGGALSMGAGAAVAALSLLALAPARLWSASRALQIASGAQGLAHVRLLQDLPARRAQWAAQSVQSVRKDRLPDEWLREIREAGGTVDAIPADLGFLIESGLRFAPSPLLTSANAFTAALDARQAAHYQGDRAADFLVVGCQGGDGRSVVLEMPQALRAVRDSYEVAARHADGTRLLLRRRKLRQKTTLQFAPPVFTTPQRGATITPAQQGAFAAAHLPLLPSGRLMAALFRIPPVFVRLTFADGTSSRSRLSLANAEGGLPLGAVPRTAAELARWLGGEAVAQVREFHLEGPGLPDYGEVLGLSWSKR